MNLITPSLTLNPASVPATLGSIDIQPPAGTAFTFTAGQMIEATVQQVINSVVWLKAEGQMFQARTETPLQVGQQVQLKVAEIGPGRVNLQLQAAPPSLSPLQRGGSEGVETLLASWSLATDPVNLDIAHALLTHTQTLQPEDIQEIRAQWQALSSLPQPLTPNIEAAPQQVEALTFLHTHQLPVSRESLTLAQNWLKGLPHLTEQLTALQTHLDEVVGQLHRTAGDNPALEQLQDTLLAVRTVLNNWSISPEYSREQIIRSLNQFISQVGTPAEAELATTLLNGATLSPLPVETSKGEVLRTLKAEAEATPSTNPLHRLTLTLSETLTSQANLDKPTAAVLHRLADQLNRFSDDLGALHLANLSTPDNRLVEPYYFFPIPVSTPDGPATAQLKVYQQPGQREVDPKNMRLALLLDLPSLGEIAIDLTIFERHLTGRILSGRDETHTLVEREVGELQQSLSSLGYQVDALSCDVLTLNPQGASSVERPTLNVKRLTFNGIDVSA
ncbi:MAG: flagellar hook-length control protein FliK [Anaerolineae bacterium]